MLLAVGTVNSDWLVSIGRVSRRGSISWLPPLWFVFYIKRIYSNKIYLDRLRNQKIPMRCLGKTVALRLQMKILVESYWPLQTHKIKLLIEDFPIFNL